MLVELYRSGSKGLSFLIKNSQDGGSTLTGLAKAGSEFYARYLAEESIGRIIQNYTNLGGVQQTDQKKQWDLLLDISESAERRFSALGDFVDPPQARANSWGDTVASRSWEMYRSSTSTSKATDSASTSKATADSDSESRTSTSRSLLQSDVDVERYSTLISAISSSENVPLSARVAETWLEGPFSWPPRFEYWTSGSCPVYETTKEAAVESTQVLVKYYTGDFSASAKVPPWDLVANLPTFYNGTPPTNETAIFLSQPSVKRSVNDGDLAADYYDFFISNILGGLMGIRPEHFQAFFTGGKGLAADQNHLTAGSILREMLVCDFESVITCSRHTRNLFTSFIIAYLGYWLVATALSFLGIQGLGNLLWFLIPPLAFWLAYGISPSCFPMVPTCLVEDFINITQVLSHHPPLPPQTDPISSDPGSCSLTS